MTWVAAVRALRQIGALRWVGPEVIRPELAAMPMLQAATLAVERTRAVVAEALDGTWRSPCSAPIPIVRTTLPEAP